MWIKKRICCILLILSALVFIGYMGFERTCGQYKDEMPADFNFQANIITDSYVLDTYKNTLTKAIDWEKDTTVAFIVSKEFKESIYKLFKKIDICKYPCNYGPTSTIQILPSHSYKLKYIMDSDSIVGEINWEENTYSETKDAKRLRSVFEKIEEYIEQSDVVKTLPEDERAFL